MAQFVIGVEEMLDLVQEDNAHFRLTVKGGDGTTETHAFKMKKKVGRRGETLRFATLQTRPAESRGAFRYMGTIFADTNVLNVTRRSKMASTDRRFRILRRFWDGLHNEPSRIAHAVEGGMLKFETGL